MLSAQAAIENDLKQRFEGLFQLDYDLLLYDLTSSYFEGLAEENDLARRGYSRDHRSDCQQIVLALIVTRDGFPLAHETLAGNTKDVQTVRRIVTAVERRFGQSQRVWVMDRGMISEDTLGFLNEPNRRYLLATRRHELTRFQTELRGPGWQPLPEHPGVEVQASTATACITCWPAAATAATRNAPSAAASAAGCARPAAATRPRRQRAT